MSSKEKRGCAEIVADCKILIFDVEGTTTSISFVKDTLFPYVRSNLQTYVANHWNTDELKADLVLLRKQADQDVEDQVEKCVPIPSDGNDDELQAAVIANVLWQMDIDRKTKALKQLQGHIMREGYTRGVLKGHVYPDVAPAMRTWTENGMKLYIYSSGSVDAQKLLFGNSQQGNLLEFLQGHFDTEVGSKQDAESYKKISKLVDCSPSEIVFFTDVSAEAKAAQIAGMTPVLVVREGNAPLSKEDRELYEVVESFDGFLAMSPKKRLKISVSADVPSGDVNMSIVSEVPIPTIPNIPSKPVESNVMKGSGDVEHNETKEDVVEKAENMEVDMTMDTADVIVDANKDTVLDTERNEANEVAAEVDADNKTDGDKVKVDSDEKVKVNIDKEVKVEAEKELKVDAEKEVKLDTEKEVKLDTEKEVKLDTEKEVKLDTEKEVKLDTEKEVKLDTEKEVKLDTEKEVKLDTEKEVKLDTEKEVKLDTEKEVKLDTEKEVKLDTVKEVVKEITLDAVKDVDTDKDVAAETGKEIAEVVEKSAVDAVKEIAMDQDVAEDVNKQISVKTEKEIVTDLEKRIVVDSAEGNVVDTEQVAMNVDEETVIHEQNKNVLDLDKRESGDKTTASSDVQSSLPVEANPLPHIDDKSETSRAHDKKSAQKLEADNEGQSLAAAVTAVPIANGTREEKKGDESHTVQETADESEVVVKELMPEEKQDVAIEKDSDGNNTVSINGKSNPSTTDVEETNNSSAECNTFAKEQVQNSVEKVDGVKVIGESVDRPTDSEVNGLKGSEACEESNADKESKAMELADGMDKENTTKMEIVDTKDSVEKSEVTDKTNTNVDNKAREEIGANGSEQRTIEGGEEVPKKAETNGTLHTELLDTKTGTHPEDGKKNNGVEMGQGDAPKLTELPTNLGNEKDAIQVDGATVKKLPTDSADDDAENAVPVTMET